VYLSTRERDPKCEANKTARQIEWVAHQVGAWPYPILTWTLLLEMGRAFVLSIGEITLLSAALLSLGYLAGSSRNKSRSSPPPAAAAASSALIAATKQPKAFVLAVNLKFTTLGHRDAFLRLVDPLCKDVLVNEGPKNHYHSSTSSSASTTTETTLSYKVAISDKNPLLVLILERYSDKDYGYLQVHRSGSEFQKFREKLKGMEEEGGVEIHGESYLETDLGFV
jgi:quinol monooxygenase YgiN